MYESSLFSFFRSERVRPCCLPLVKLVCPSNAKGNIIMSPSIHRCTKQGGLRLTIYHWKTNSKYQVYYKIKTSSNCAVLHIFHIGALYFWFSIPSLSNFKALQGSFLCMWKHLMVQRCFHQLNGPSAVQIENLSHLGLLLWASPNFGPILLDYGPQGYALQIKGGLWE